jgi:hypothetical protein
VCVCWRERKLELEEPATGCSGRWCGRPVGACNRPKSIAADGGGRPQLACHMPAGGGAGEAAQGHATLEASRLAALRRDWGQAGLGQELAGRGCE